MKLIFDKIEKTDETKHHSVFKVSLGPGTDSLDYLLNATFDHDGQEFRIDRADTVERDAEPPFREAVLAGPLTGNQKLLNSVTVAVDEGLKTSTRDGIIAMARVLLQEQR